MNQNRKSLSSGRIRAVLLAGASAAALSLSPGAAHAQTLSIGANTTTDNTNKAAITSSDGQGNRTLLEQTGIAICDQFNNNCLGNQTLIGAQGITTGAGSNG